MKLQHPIVVDGVTYSVISPRVRGSAAEWSTYDEHADEMEKLLQAASIMCDVPRDVLLALDADDFFPLMHEVGQMAVKFAKKRK